MKPNVSYLIATTTKNNYHLHQQHLQTLLTGSDATASTNNCPKITPGGNPKIIIGTIDKYFPLLNLNCLHLIKDLCCIVLFLCLFTLLSLCFPCIYYYLKLLIDSWHCFYQICVSPSSSVTDYICDEVYFETKLNTLSTTQSIFVWCNQCNDYIRSVMCVNF